MQTRTTDDPELLANGLPFEEILEERPDLKRGDILGAMRLAPGRIDLAVVAACDSGWTPDSF